MDTRIEKLAKVLSGYSCSLKPGEKVLIEYRGEDAKPLVQQLIRETYLLGAKPFIIQRDDSILREILLGADEAQLKLQYDLELAQMQQMQRQMEQMQAELEEKEITTTSGGGAVSVTVNGKKEIVSLTLDKDVVDPDDVEMLQDLVMAAVNEGMRQIDEISSAEMGKLTGGLNIPGLM